MTTDARPPIGVALDAMCRTMAGQHGVISTAAARALGVSRAVERRLVRDGVVREGAPGVLVSTSAPTTWEQRALVAVLGPGQAVVSHGAAARLHGLAGFARHEHVDVVCRKGRRAAPTAGTIAHHTRGLTDVDVAEVDGIRCLTVAATLTLLAPVAGVAATARALESALRAGHAADDLRSVASRWRRRGRPGPAALLALLDDLARPT